ncbi:MAG: hypothetical protein ABIQ29_05555 [Burkholderiaceae bacterium]
MHTDISPLLPPRPRWSTSAFAQDHDADDNVATALCAHLNSCRSVNGRWFSVRCGVDAVRQFLAPRLVTTLVVITLLVGVAFSVA